MGYMRHHAIVVTACDEILIEEAQLAAFHIFPWVSPVSPKTILSEIVAEGAVPRSGPVLVAQRMMILPEQAEELHA